MAASLYCRSLAASPSFDKCGRPFRHVRAIGCCSSSFLLASYRSLLDAFRKLSENPSIPAIAILASRELQLNRETCSKEIFSKDPPYDESTLRFASE
jgi:hypothetical protein